MPVKAVLRGGKYRIVESRTGRILRTRNGKPRDGGGHRKVAKAKKQARAINSNI